MVKKFTCVSIVCSLICVAVCSCAEVANGSGASGKSSIEGIFDFDKFKTVFGKSYEHCQLEELARHKIFLGRAFRALISFVAFKHYKRSYFLKITEWSDWTQQEMDALSMKQTLLGVTTVGEEVNPETPVAANLTSVEKELAQLIEQQPDIESLFNESSQRVRTKRDLNSAKVSYRESVTLKDFYPVQSSDESPEIDRKVSSNNLNYKPPELASFGTESEIRNNESPKLSQEVLQEIIDRQNSKLTLDSSWEFLLSDPKSGSSKKDHSSSEEMYIDHRRSGCINMAKNQGRCGSCYIFALTSLYEWQYCQESGERVSFSEQYPLDCGELVGMKGCAGGTEVVVGRFYGRYGFELSLNYPYRARSDICPYSEDENPRRMGYLKLNRDNGGLVRVQYEKIADHLKHRPVAIGIGLSEDFIEYGGGVYDGHKCRRSNWHSLAIVGMGREDGDDYWLMRNSYGPKFGLNGYYKLNTKAKHCFSDKGVGFVVMPADRKRIFNLEGNEQYEATYVSQRLSDYLAGKPVERNPSTYVDHS